MALPAVENVLTPKELEATLKRRREIDALMEQAQIVMRAGDTETTRSLLILAAMRGDVFARDWCMAHQAHPDEEVPLLKDAEAYRGAAGFFFICLAAGSFYLYYSAHSAIYFYAALIATFAMFCVWIKTLTYHDEIADLCHYARRMPKDAQSIAKLAERRSAAKWRLDQLRMERQQQEAAQVQGQNLHGGSRAASASEAAAAASGGGGITPQRMFDN